MAKLLTGQCRVYSANIDQHADLGHDDAKVGRMLHFCTLRSGHLARIHESLAIKLSK